MLECFIKNTFNIVGLDFVDDDKENHDFLNIYLVQENKI